MLRLVALVACGTRTVIDAAFGPAGTGETRYAARLVPALREQMIVLADRNFVAGYLTAMIAAIGAHLLVRVRAGRTGVKLPALHRHHDGSFVSLHGGVKVRVIDAEITVVHHRRHHHRRLPADHHPARPPPLPGLRPGTAYHQRWEIETAYLELKSSILGGRVLRARRPEGIDQEVYALLVTYQVLRIAMTDATNSDSRHRPRPSRVHHRPARRPRPGHPSRRRHHRHRHRPGRRDRHAGPGQPPTRPARRASTPAPSNERSPNTTPEAQTSTEPPTKPPSPSTSSPHKP